MAAQLPVCPLHGKPFELFDKKNCRLVCSVCVPPSHQNFRPNDFQSITEAANSSRDGVEELTARARAFVGELQQADEKADGMLSELQQNYQQEKNKMKAVFNAAHETLLARERELCAQFEELLNDKSAELSRQRDDMLRNRDGLEMREQRVQMAAEGETSIPLLLAKSELSSLLATSLRPALGECSPLEFWIDPLTVKAFSEAGCVKDKETSAVKTTLTVVEGTADSTFLITARNRQGLPRGVGGEHFTVEVKGDHKVEDKNDGTYRVTCLGKTDCTLSVQFKGQHVQGSPCEVKTKRVETFVSMWGAQGQIPSPFHFAVSSAGEVFMTDATQHQIQVLRMDGTFVRKWGGKGNRPGQFESPSGIAVSKEGEVFVTDQGNARIQVFRLDGTFLRMFGAGKGKDPGCFRDPRGIAVFGAHVAVCDSGNWRMQVFTIDGTLVSAWGGYGEAHGKFASPFECALSNKGEVVVADYGNARIQVFKPDGTFLRGWGSRGEGPGQFSDLSGVAVSELGEVFVAASHCIQVFRCDGTLSRSWGAKGTGEGQFDKPVGVALSSTGHILVGEYPNHRIQVFH